MGSGERRDVQGHDLLLSLRGRFYDVHHYTFTHDDTTRRCLVLEKAYTTTQPRDGGVDRGLASFGSPPAPACHAPPLRASLNVCM